MGDIMFEKNIILSIVVIFYNNEDYIEKCLKSIAPFINENIELVLVNDGSTDNSYKLAKNLVSGYNNIKLLSQINSGISAARNMGLKESKGKYIVFIDGDDYLNESISLEQIVELIETYGEDIYLFKTIKYFENKKKFSFDNFSFSQEQFNIQNKDKKLQLLINNKIFARVSRVIVKKNLLIKNNLFFNEKVVYEDEEWFLKTILMSKNIYFIDQNFYIYRKRNNSLTSTRTTSKVKDLLEIINNCYNFIISDNWSKNSIKYFRSAMVRCLRIVFTNASKFDDTYYYLNWYSDNKKIVYYIIKNNYFLKIIINLLGPQRAFKIYKKIKKIMN